jgi:hypothetical protein
VSAELEALPAPENLSCSVEETTVYLQWDYEASEGVVIRIMRDGALLSEVASDDVSYEDAMVEAGLYEYSLQAVREDDRSAAVSCSAGVILPPRVVMSLPDDAEDILVEEPAGDVLLYELELQAPAEEGVVFSALVLTSVGDSDLDRLSDLRLFVDLDDDRLFSAEADALLSEGRIGEGKLIFDSFSFELDPSERVWIRVIGDIHGSEEVMKSGFGFSLHNGPLSGFAAVLLILLTTAMMRCSMVRKALCSLFLVLVMFGFSGCSESSSHAPKSDPVAPAMPRIFYQFAVDSPDDIDVEGRKSGRQADIEGLPATGHKTEISF